MRVLPCAHLMLPSSVIPFNYSHYRFYSVSGITGITGNCKSITFSYVTIKNTFSVNNITEYNSLTFFYYRSYDQILFLFFCVMNQRFVHRTTYNLPIQYTLDALPTKPPLSRPSSSNFSVSFIFL